jgi:Na+/proline symporter
MLAAADYFTFFLILFIPVFIGIYHGGGKDFIKKYFRKWFNKNKTNENESIEMDTRTEDAKKVAEFVIADSNMNGVAISFSLVASYFSTTTLLGMPAEIYVYGGQMFITAFANCITPIIGSFVTGPFFDNLGIVSINEFLEMRFESQRIRVIITSVSVFKSLVACAIEIFGPAISFSVFTGISTNLSIALIGIIATFYTAIGYCLIIN